jgi:hypothetical protein
MLTEFEKSQNLMGIHNTIDWCDEQEVVRYARTFKSRMAVYKHPDRENYNIAHASRIDLFQSDWVVAYV